MHSIRQPPLIYQDQPFPIDEIGLYACISNTCSRVGYLCGLGTCQRVYLRDGTNIDDRYRDDASTREGVTLLYSPCT